MKKRRAADVPGIRYPLRDAMRTSLDFALRHALRDSRSADFDIRERVRSPDMQNLLP